MGGGGQMCSITGCLGRRPGRPMRPLALDWRRDLRGLRPSGCEGGREVDILSSASLRVPGDQVWSGNAAH